MNIMEINGVLDSIHSGNNKGSIQGSGFVATPLVEYVSKSTPMDFLLYLQWMFKEIVMI